MILEINGLKIDLGDHSSALGVYDEVFTRDIYGIKSIWESHKVLGGCIIDVGAHVGVFSVLCKSYWPGSKVYSFEAHPDNFRMLSQNTKDFIAMNTYNLAVLGGAEYSDEANLIVDPYLSNTGGSTVAESRGMVAKNDSEFNSIEVRATRLSSLFKDKKIEECSLLKLDCESSEFGIIDDLFENDLLKRVCWIRGEYHLESVDYDCRLNQMIAKIDKTHSVVAYQEGVNQAIGCFVAHRR